MSMSAFVKIFLFINLKTTSINIIPGLINNQILRM